MTNAATSAVQTAPLHMIRATLEMRPMRQWMGERRLTDVDHALHCLLGETMGDAAPQPHRLLVRPEATQATLLGYTSAPGAELALRIRETADPLQEQIIRPEAVQAKAMPTEWQTGRRYSFEARVRPVVRERETKREIDVYRQVERQRTGGTPPSSREQVYTRWLAGQLARGGAATLEPDSAILVSYHEINSVRRAHGQPSPGPDVVMRGHLNVDQPEAFTALLARGLGRHRAFGYGMLLLHPAQR